MPNNTPASGITISFTRDEIEWLSWAMDEVLTSFTRENTAKNKILSAQELLAITDKIRDPHNHNVGGSEEAQDSPHQPVRQPREA
jgi:hypothetical protein